MGQIIQHLMCLKHSIYVQLRPVSMYQVYFLRAPLLSHTTRTTEHVTKSDKISAYGNHWKQCGEGGVRLSTASQMFNFFYIGPT